MMRPQTTFFTLLLIFACCMPDAFALDYPKGHRALEVFDAAGMDATPPWVRRWLMFMGACFAAGLLFIRQEPIARWVVGCFIIGMISLSISVSLGVLQLSGFIALLHLIFWSPALYQLVTKRPFLNKPASAFTIWTAIITAVILFSFIFDTRDAFIYLMHIL